MSEKQAKRKCDICAEECDGSIEYGVSLSEQGDDSGRGFDHKRVCRDCYLRIKVSIIEILRTKMRRKLMELSESFPSPVES